MKKTLLAILTLAMTLGLTLTTALPVFAGSARGRLIPDTSDAYVSGSGGYSFDIQSDNTVIVNLNIKKLTPDQVYTLVVSYEGPSENNEIVGYPIADENGTLSYTGFAYENTYPDGFASAGGYTACDFIVRVFVGKITTLPDPLYTTDEVLESDYVTLSLN